MKDIVSTIVSVFLFLSASALLSGCGGSGSSGSTSSTGTTTGGGAAYGTLTLTGTGTATTGTTFNALSRLAITSSGITVTQWYNIDLAAGTTYPYVVLAVTQDSVGAITGVSISNMVGVGTASGQWVLSAPLVTEASATATTVTFTHLVVPGYAAASTTTSLTLNGTLQF